MLHKVIQTILFLYLIVGFFYYLFYFDYPYYYRKDTNYVLGSNYDIDLVKKGATSSKYYSRELRFYQTDSAAIPCYLFLGKGHQYFELNLLNKKLNCLDLATLLEIDLLKKSKQNLAWSARSNLVIIYPDTKYILDFSHISIQNNDLNGIE